MASGDLGICVDANIVVYALGLRTAPRLAETLAGSYVEPGPARAWMRQRVPLVEGREPSPLERLLVAADSGNGVSAPLDYRRFVFINTDLSVALRRPPTSDWIGLDAVSHAEPDGIGLTDTTIHDERGPLGRVTQSLLIADRGHS